MAPRRPWQGGGGWQLSAGILGTCHNDRSVVSHPEKMSSLRFCLTMVSTTSTMRSSLVEPSIQSVRQQRSRLDTGAHAPQMSARTMDHSG